MNEKKRQLYQEVGKHIKDMCNKYGVTRKQLAAAVGVTRSCVDKIIDGTNPCASDYAEVFKSVFLERAKWLKKDARDDCKLLDIYVNGLEVVLYEADYVRVGVNKALYELQHGKPKNALSTIGHTKGETVILWENLTSINGITLTSSLSAEQFTNLPMATREVYLLFLEELIVQNIILACIAPNSEMKSQTRHYLTHIITNWELLGEIEDRKLWEIAYVQMALLAYYCGDYDTARKVAVQGLSHHRYVTYEGRVAYLRAYLGALAALHFGERFLRYAAKIATAIDNSPFFGENRENALADFYSSIGVLLIEHKPVRDWKEKAREYFEKANLLKDRLGARGKTRFLSLQFRLATAENAPIEEILKYARLLKSAAPQYERQLEELLQQIKALEAPYKGDNRIEQFTQELTQSLQVLKLAST